LESGSADVSSTRTISIQCVDVFVADHGIHTSLILPRSDGTIVQYAYSRFSWAALDQDQWYRSLDALIVPGDGAIGVREFPGPATRENVLHQCEVAGIYPVVHELYLVTVSEERCRHLLANLDLRWQSHQDTAIDNPRRGLKFTRDPARYSLGHNCNHEVAGWLRELGCKVDGAAMTAEIRVREVKRRQGEATFQGGTEH